MGLFLSERHKARGSGLSSWGGHFMSWPLPVVRRCSGYVKPSSFREPDLWVRGASPGFAKYLHKKRHSYSLQE